VEAPAVVASALSTGNTSSHRGNFKKRFLFGPDLNQGLSCWPIARYSTNASLVNVQAMVFFIC
jgi:hypothetical protein